MSHQPETLCHHAEKYCFLSQYFLTVLKVCAIVIHNLHNCNEEKSMQKTPLQRTLSAEKGYGTICRTWPQSMTCQMTENHQTVRGCPIQRYGIDGFVPAYLRRLIW